jgi:hypothetical protein
MPGQVQVVPPEAVLVDCFRESHRKGLQFTPVWILAKMVAIRLGSAGMSMASLKSYISSAIARGKLEVTKSHEKLIKQTVSLSPALRPAWAQSSTLRPAFRPAVQRSKAASVQQPVARAP